MNAIPRIVFGMEQRGVVPPTADASDVMQVLRRRMLLVSEYIRAVWNQRALDMGMTDTGSYIRGISAEARIRTTYQQNGPTSMRATVEVTNTCPHAKIVEDGHRAFHLPSRIRWFDPSLNVKHGKKGPYLHIPFRHYTSTEAGNEKGGTNTAVRQQMPDDVYRKAIRLRRRVAVSGPVYGPGTYTAPNGSLHSGMLFRQAHLYQWRGSSRARKRLSHGSDTPQITVGPDGTAVESQRSARGVAGAKGATNPAWGGSKYDGLMKTGPSGHTRYLTVRTITPTSPGWWIPARHGRGIRRQVLLVLQYGEGARQLQDLIGGALIEEVT